MQHKPESTGTIALPPQATTVTAADLHTELVSALSHGDDLEIDASDVESVGQAVLQLLIAAQCEADRTGAGCRIINPSAAFSERVARCGLADRIGLPAQEGHKS